MTVDGADTDASRLISVKRSSIEMSVLRLEVCLEPDVVAVDELRRMTRGERLVTDDVVEVVGLLRL